MTLKLGPDFPYGTLTANLAGCFLIGLLAGRIEVGKDPGELAKLLFMTGFLGSFTTFSTFSLETFRMVQQQQIGAALVNLFLHLFVGLVAVVAGLNLARL